jgi:hypothetical protein
MAVAFSLIFKRRPLRAQRSKTVEDSDADEDEREGHGHKKLCTNTGLLVIRVVLGFLPEVIAALVCIFVGIKTQGAAQKTRMPMKMSEKATAIRSCVRNISTAF